ncbi:lamin tail domain-containing protein, partial [Flavobacteriaceae bacterium]|nr:lamin tail domain-containing protein [Flavobacteriaceae bacterium]
MKRITLFFTLLSFTFSFSQLIITEIADPDNNSNNAGLRYVEIYNPTASSISLSNYYLIRWTNSNSHVSNNISISSECGSSLAANTFCIISSDTNDGNDFLTTYGFNPHGKAGTGGSVDSNGDDNIALVTSSSITNSDPSTWTVIDLYGVPGTDGSNQNHEFEDGRAERKASSTTPSSTWNFSDWNIDNDGGDGDGAQNAPGGYDPGYWIGATTIDTWNGLSTNAWGTASNWASGSTPASGDKIFIRDSGTDPVISTTGNQISDITIESGGSLSIDKGKNLTLSGNFSNSGTMTLNSDSNEFASLIVQGTSSGNITYKRYVSDEGTDEWDLIGSPVAGQTISGFVSANSSLADTGSQYAIGVFSNDGSTDTAAAMYTNVTSADLSGSFTAGIGYGMATDEADTPGTTLDFTGTVRTSDLSVAIDDESATLTNFGKWNLIANPFPSYLNANSATSGTNFMTVNTSNLHSSYAYIYGYDGDGTWTLYNNSSSATYIAPGQAFFVASDDSGGNAVTFSEAMQTVSGTDDFIAGDIVEDSFELILKLYEGDTEIDYTRFYFKDGLNLSLDPGYDAGHFNQQASLMSRLLEEDQGHGLVINAMGLENVNDVVVPIVINREAGTDFRISIDTFGIYAGTNVYLEDNEQGT